MKITRSQWMVVATASLIVAASTAQSAADRPPGIDESRWVPISDTAGIVLTEVTARSGQIRPEALERMPEALRLQLQSLNRDAITLRPATGILMVKHRGAWMRVDLELPPARVQPLH